MPCHTRNSGGIIFELAGLHHGQQVTDVYIDITHAAGSTVAVPKQLPPNWYAFLEAMRADVSEARLAQSAERKALNLVVVGSSPTVGV